MSVRRRELSDGTEFWQTRFRETRDDGQVKEASVSWDTEEQARKFDTLVKKYGPAKAREICRIVASPSRALTVTQWLNEHNDGLTGVEPGTLARYRAYVINDIDPAFGDVPLTALTRGDVAAWVNAMHTAGSSGKTIANKHGYLAGALTAAVLAGRIKANPCEGNRLPRWDRQEMVFLTRDQYRALKSAVPEYWRPLVEFLVVSGCRWSEATALTPAAIDVVAGTVRITKAWKTGAGGYTLGVPKTKKTVRTINVPVSVLEQLDLTGDWVFTNSGRGNGDPDGPVRIHSFHPNVWVPAVTRARDRTITNPPLTTKPRVHDLRHTCASWLIQAGIPLPVIQQHLGHESITTTVGTYGHLDRASAKAAADALGAALS